MDSVPLVTIKKRILRKIIGIFFSFAHFCDPAIFVKTGAWLLSRALPIMQNTIKNCWNHVGSFLYKFSISSKSVTT